MLVRITAYRTPGMVHLELIARRTAMAPPPFNVRRILGTWSWAAPLEGVSRSE